MEADSGAGMVQPAVRRSGLIIGLLSPLRGAVFFKNHPKLITYAVIPIIINTVLFIVFFYFSLSYFNRWLEALLPQEQAWYWVALTYLLTVILILILLIIIVFTFTVLANLLASPFNDALSARTETLALGLQSGEPFSLKAIVREIGRTIIEELKKIVLFLGTLALISLLNLVPVLGQVLSMVLGGLLTILWLGLSFLDYALARHGYRLGAKIKFIRRNLLPVFGYGLGVFAGLLVPVLNLAFIPMAVVGGTLLYLDLSGNGNRDAIN